MNARLILCTVFLLATACSTQYRTSDPQVSSTDMMQYLSDAQGASTQSTGSQEVSPTDPATMIFFGDAPGPMGTVASFLAFGDYTFMGSTTPAPLMGTVSQVRVFFLDNPNNGHAVELIIGTMAAGSTDYTYFKYYGNAGTSDGKYQASVTGNGTTFTVRSYDIDGDSLMSTIQLEVVGTDGDGNEYSFGKFTVLAGFQ